MSASEMRGVLVGQSVETFYSSNEVAELRAGPHSEALDTPLPDLGRSGNRSAFIVLATESIPSRRRRAKTTPLEQSIWFPCL
jgi:hypothetical protein